MVAKQGDHFLLFHNLPYQFDEELPIKIVSALYLNETPSQTLAAAPLPWACFVLPGYETGAGFSHCCLHSPISEKSLLGRARNTLFFEFVTSLRLYAPIGINISGSFELGDSDHLIMNPSLFNTRSPWQSKSQERYSGKDIKNCKKIFKALIKGSEDKYQRLKLAIVLFSQVTCGFSYSYQMCYLALFSALEALFAPKGNKAKTLSTRVAHFLASFDPEKRIKEWLENEYKVGRSKLAHGVWEISPDAKTSEEKNNAFGYLHELTGLTILGFLSMDEDRWLALSQNGTALQKELENLSPAAGLFLNGQFMWSSLTTHSSRPRYKFASPRRLNSADMQLD